MSELKNGSPQTETQTQEDTGALILSTPVVKYDWGNRKGGYIEIKAVTATGICSEVSPSYLGGMRDFRSFWRYAKLFKCFDTQKLKEICPDYIPVTIKTELMFNNASDIGENIYLVHGDMPLGEFVEFIRRFLGTFEPMSVFSKNTVLPTEALMSAINEENSDMDGFLRMIFCEVDGSARSRELMRLRMIEERKEECPYPDRVVRRKRTHSRKWEEKEMESGSSSWEEKSFIPFRPIRYLDPWNGIGAGFVPNWKPEGPDSYKTHKILKWYGAMYHDHRDIDPFQLRETCPDYIPLCVEKDAKSDIPDIGAKKYQVHGDMPYCDLAEFIRVKMAPYGYIKPIYVILHSTTQPPTDVSKLGITEDTLMHEVDEKYKDEDGYLHFTYTWEDQVSVSGEDHV